MLILIIFFIFFLNKKVMLNNINKINQQALNIKKKKKSQSPSLQKLNWLNNKNLKQK